MLTTSCRICLRAMCALILAMGMTIADEAQPLPVGSGWGMSDDAAPVAGSGIDALTVRFTTASGDQRVWSFQRDCTRTWKTVDGQQVDVITGPASASLPDLARLAQTLVPQAPETPSVQAADAGAADGLAAVPITGSVCIILKTDATTPPLTIVLPCRRDGQVPDQAVELIHAMKAEVRRLIRHDHATCSARPQTGPATIVRTQ